MNARMQLPLAHVGERQSRRLPRAPSLPSPSSFCFKSSNPLWQGRLLRIPVVSDLVTAPVASPTPRALPRYQLPHYPPVHLARLTKPLGAFFFVLYFAFVAWALLREFGKLPTWMGT
jgi:hypothetical protein